MQNSAWELQNTDNSGDYIELALVMADLGQ